MSDNYYYEYEQDNYYCYPGTYILKNKLNIRDAEELKKVEREITSLRTAQLMQNPIKGNFSFEYLKRIHKFLFGDIYDWAGKIRNVNISKGNEFCRCEFIEEQMNNVLRQLINEEFLSGLDEKNISARLAYYLGEINAIHPFREGNGRTQRMFIECLAKENGYKLDFSKITSTEMIESSAQTFNMEYELMEKLFLSALSR